ncbi:MAG: hypothetical protein ACRDNZ_20590 [Streptosporangiaceae bacterium]
MSEEEALFRALRIAGPHGLTLAECRAKLTCSRSRREEVIATIRGAEWITEGWESRPGADGRPRRQIVLRLTSAEPSDPAVRAWLEYIACG